MNAPKTEEWKQYMRDLWTDPEYKSNMIQVYHKAHLAQTPERKAEIAKIRSEATKGRHMSPNTEFKPGHKFDQETLQKMSESKIGQPTWNKGTVGVVRPNSGSFQLGHTPWMKGTHITTPSSFQSGSNHRMAKLNEDQVLQIIELNNQGMKKQDIADKFGVSLNSIHGIVGGRRWNHITGLPKAK